MHHGERRGVAWRAACVSSEGLTGLLERTPHSTLFIVLSPNKNPVAQHISVHAWHPPPHAALRTPDPRP